LKCFVLDCSVTMCWCFEDQGNDYTERILDQLSEDEAWVPSIWPLEVANVLAVGEQQKRITEAKSMQFLRLLNELPILVDESTHTRALDTILSIARKHGLSSYDAAYLELAMREGIPIATEDKMLKSTASMCGLINV
jgi:predicted nucleic acid-binding protein